LKRLMATRKLSQYPPSPAAPRWNNRAGTDGFELES